MVCMNPVTTSKIIDSLVDGYDADVISWSTKIAEVSNTMLACM